MFKFFEQSIIKKILIVLLFFEIVIISYIYIFIYPKIEENNRNYAESSLKQLSIEKRKSAEYLFEQVEHEAVNLGLWVLENLHKDVTEEEVSNIFEEYYINENSIFTGKIDEDNKSSIFLTYNNDLSHNVIKDIINTSKMDKNMKMSKERLPYAECIFYITDYDMIRMYPYDKNDPENFKFGHDFKKDVYYLIATKEYNPERKPVWTNPYCDYLGKGLVITCSYPVYDDNKMIGVVGIDVGLSELQKSVSDLSIKGKGISFLTDDKGRIIYYPDYQLNNNEKGFVVKDHINMFAETEEEKTAYDKMIKEKKGFIILNSRKKEELLIFDKIEKLGWIIGIQVDRHEYAEDTGVYFILFELLIFSAVLIILLLLYFYNILSKPIFKLVNEIHEMGERHIGKFITKNFNDEIKIVSNAFAKLRIELDDYIKKLNHKNIEFTTIFNNMPGILYIIDKNYNLLLYNKNSEKLINFNHNDKNCKKCFKLIFNKDKVCDNCPVMYSLNDNTEYTCEVHNHNNIYNVSSFPIYDHDYSIEEIIILSIDKTAEIVKNLELANSEKFSMIGEISASVAHQLKNNISVIKGACYLLNDIESENYIDTNDVREVIKDLSESIMDAENTVASLLDFSGHGDEFAYVDLIKIIEQILVIEKNNFYKNDIIVNKKYEYEKLCIFTRVNSLKFVLINIIRNAIEAMKDEGGNLTIKIYENNNFIHIEISDTGIGIDNKIKTKIYDPFFTTKENGTGLGLWIANKQMKKLNGYLYCEKRINDGTNFIIVLPIKQEK